MFGSKKTKHGNKADSRDAICIKWMSWREIYRKPYLFTWCWHIFVHQIWRYRFPPGHAGTPMLYLCGSAPVHLGGNRLSEGIHWWSNNSPSSTEMKWLGVPKSWGYPQTCHVPRILPWIFHRFFHRCFHRFLHDLNQPFFSGSWIPPAGASQTCSRRSRSEVLRLGAQRLKRWSHGNITGRSSNYGWWISDGHVWGDKIFKFEHSLQIIMDLIGIFLLHPVFFYAKNIHTSIRYSQISSLVRYSTPMRSHKLIRRPLQRLAW